LEAVARHGHTGDSQPAVGSFRVVYIDEFGSKVVPSMGDPISDNALSEVVEFISSAIEHATKALGVSGCTVKIEWAGGLMVLRKTGNRTVALMAEI